MLALYHKSTKIYEYPFLILLCYFPSNLISLFEQSELTIHHCYKISGIKFESFTIIIKPYFCLLGLMHFIVFMYLLRQEIYSSEFNMRSCFNTLV